VLLREIEARNRGGAPAVIDVHTWEFDPDPPRVPLPLLYRLAHYGGLSGYRAKLEELLKSVPWSPARDYVLSQGESPNFAARIARAVPSASPSTSTSAAGE